MLNPNQPHPGKVLLENFIKPLRISYTQLSKELHVPVNRVSGLVDGSRNITTDTALRLARYFGNRPEEWMTWQMGFDLAEARKPKGLEERIKAEVKTRASSEQI